MRRANDLGGQAARSRPVFKMWSSLVVVTFLFVLGVVRGANVDGKDPGTRSTKSNVVFYRTEERPSTKNRIGKSNRIFDFVKSDFDYRDNVMVMSPPLKVTLNKSPQKNESLFRISKTLKKNSDNTVNAYSKLFKRLDILRASFDPRDSVMVMSPPLKVTLNNSPQKNDSLFRVSRNGDKNEGNHRRGASAQDREVENVANSMREEKPGRADDSSTRKKRETSALNDNGTKQQLIVNHRYHNQLTNDDSDEKQKVSPTPTPSSSRYRQNRWPRELISYLFVPIMFILGYAPLALWGLKMLVYKGLILSKVAFLAAIYMGLRTLIFGTPVSAVKYYNYGYDNDQLNHLVDPAWQTA